MWGSPTERRASKVPLLTPQDKYLYTSRIDVFFGGTGFQYDTAQSGALAKMLKSKWGLKVQPGLGAFLWQVGRVLVGSSSAE